MPGSQIHALPTPKKKPTGYIADPDKGFDYHWIPDTRDSHKDRGHF